MYNGHAPALGLLCCLAGVPLVNLQTDLPHVLQVFICFMITLAKMEICTPFSALLVFLTCSLSPFPTMLPIFYHTALMWSTLAPQGQ